MPSIVTTDDFKHVQLKIVGLGGSHSNSCFSSCRGNAAMHNNNNNDNNNNNNNHHHHQHQLTVC